MYCNYQCESNLGQIHHAEKARNKMDSLDRQQLFYVKISFEGLIPDCQLWKCAEEINQFPHDKEIIFQIIPLVSLILCLYDLLFKSGLHGNNVNLLGLLNITQHYSYNSVNLVSDKMLINIY